MAFDDLTITGNYSDYYILEEEKEAITENDNVWVKTPQNIRRWRVLSIPYSKKEDNGHLKIKWTDSRIEDRIIIKNVSLKYYKREFRCPHNSTLMVHTWRKQSMISPLKSDKRKINDNYR